MIILQSLIDEDITICLYLACQINLLNCMHTNIPLFIGNCYLQFVSIFRILPLQLRNTLGGLHNMFGYMKYVLQKYEPLISMIRQK